MPAKPKQWALTSESEKFKMFHYEAGEGSNSLLWIDLRWSIKRELYVSFRSNAIDGGAVWLSFARPIKHHAVAKRQAFEMIGWASVPTGAVANAETEEPLISEEKAHVGPERVTVDRPAPKLKLKPT